MPQKTKTPKIEPEQIAWYVLRHLTLVGVVVGFLLYFVYPNFIFWVGFSVFIISLIVWAIVCLVWVENFIDVKRHTRVMREAAQKREWAEIGVIDAEAVFTRDRKGVSSVVQKMDVMPPPEPPPIEVIPPTPPHLVQLENVMAMGIIPSNKLFLGEDANGPVITTMTDLYHILIAGTSRWGKSIFLQSLSYQMLTRFDNINLVFIDPSNSTFNDFGLPVAVDGHAIRETLSSVWGEVERRMNLFATDLGTYRTLRQYNQDNGNSLPMLFVMCDEMTGILERTNKLAYDEVVSNLIGLITQKAAKYGVYMVVSGQDVKERVLPTSIRNQFSSRLQFKAMDSTQAGIMIKDCPADAIQTKGRVFAYINEFGGTKEIQTPYIDEKTILNLNVAPEQYTPKFLLSGGRVDKSLPMVIDQDIDTTNDYQKFILNEVDEDILAQFVYEVLVVTDNPDDTIEAKVLQSVYKDWCDDEGLKYVSKDVSSYLSAYKQRTRQGNVYGGLRVRF